MRTTIRIADQLMVEAKKVAAETGRTLRAVIEDALRDSLARRERVRSGAPVRLTTFRGEGLQTGVDLDDSAALADLMDERDSTDEPDDRR